MRILKNLKVFRPTDVTFVPMISASILNRMRQMAGDGDKIAVGKEVFGEDFSIIYSGGAYLSPEIINGYKEFGIEVAQGYGMTECSPRICSGVKNCPKPLSVGEIVPGCEVRIVDGEIQVRSKSVMQGYYKNPEETAKTLTEDGWLMTGDLGYKDEDGDNQGKITAEVYPNPDMEFDDVRAVIQEKIDEVNSGFPAAKQIVSLVIREEEFEKTASKKIIRSSVTGRQSS